MTRKRRKEICSNEHGEVPLAVTDLPESQKDPLRHVCAGCAYELGFEEGFIKGAKQTEQKWQDRVDNLAQNLMQKFEEYKGR